MPIPRSAKTASTRTTVLRKCYAIVFIDPKRRYVKGALITGEYPVTTTWTDEVQLIGHLTRGRDYAEAESRMNAILRSPNFKWLSRLIEGGRG